MLVMFNISVSSMSIGLRITMMELWLLKQQLKSTLIKSQMPVIQLTLRISSELQMPKLESA